MTQQYTDDVTGKVIGGDTERWWRVGGLEMIGPQDITDLDTLVQVIRDHLTGKSPAPIDVYTISRVPGDNPPPLARYAPKPEPAEAAKPTTFSDDSPFNVLRSFRIPPAARSSYPFRFYAEPAPAEQRAELEARVLKARAKHVRALAALCGCNDIDAHERNLP